VLAGFHYTRKRPELLGSYLADLAAMTLAYPVALFPFLAAQLHAPWSAGLMFAAPSAGALAASALSGWAGRVHRHGLAIALAAAGWGLPPQGASVRVSGYDRVELQRRRPGFLIRAWHNRHGRGNR
jgi:hypothetical protein